MTLWPPRRALLGLALDERAIHFALLASNGGGPAVKLTARFDFPDGVGWDQPEALAEALKAELRQQGVKGRRAVAGLSSRWIIAQPHLVPPVTPEAAVGVLRLAVERELGLDAREWELDYAGDADPNQARPLLVVAAPRRRIEQITRTLTLAGIEPTGLTATALVSAESAGRDPSPRAVLTIDQGAADLALCSDGRAVAIERLTLPMGEGSAWAAQLAAQVQRTLVAWSARTGLTVAGLTVRDARELPTAPVRELAERLNLPLEHAALEPDGGAAALVSRPPRLNFLHPRLADAPPRRLTRPRVLAGAAVLVLVALTLWLVGDWYVRRQTVLGLESDLEAMKTDLTQAELEVSRLKLARGWYDQRPQVLECLRALTLAAPTSDALWASSLALRDDMTGTFAGRATDQRAVLDLLERLKTSSFRDVKLLYLRQGDRNNPAVSFALAFTFQPTE